MARADSVLVRGADDSPTINRLYLAGRISPGCPRFCRWPENLDDLPIVNVRPEHTANRARVWREAIRGQLEAMRPGRTAKLLCERHGLIGRALAEMVRQHQFCFALDCQEAPHIAIFFATA